MRRKNNLTIHSRPKNLTFLKFHMQQKMDLNNTQNQPWFNDVQST